MRYKNQRGFTLIELVVVAALMTVLVGLAVADLSKHSEGMKLRSHARNILSNLRLARAKAIATRVPYGVFFDSAGRKFVLFEDRVNLTSYTFDVGDSLVYSEDLESTVDYSGCTFPNNTVIFKPDGSASSSGAVDLYSNTTHETFSIDVLASTGRVRLTQN